VTRDLSDKLFNQLDFDGSGGVSCKEFLIGLEKMVLEEYDDADAEASLTPELSAVSQ
jgi:Ca2+-binding EF-hand superfamily protein